MTTWHKNFRSRFLCRLFATIFPGFAVNGGPAIIPNCRYDRPRESFPVLGSFRRAEPRFLGEQIDRKTGRER